MKKILIAMLAALAASSQATTINWGADSAVYFGTDKVKGGVKAYLVNLGTSASWSGIKIEDIWTQDESEDSDFKRVVDTKASAATTSKVVGKVVVEPGETVGGSTLTDGSTYFGQILFYTSGETTYYNLGPSYLFDTTTTDTDIYDGTLETFSWRTTTVASNSDTAAQGWTAVPEPSVALMGLLGLGMLLKRRKA